MIEFFQGIVTYQFLANALWACLFAGIACGLIGTYIVTRRLVFLSGGITHASFGGIGIAYYLGLNPVGGAFVFSLLAAVGIEACAQHTKIREDSAIGMLWSLGMAVGIIFVYLTPGYAPNLMSFLFGNILSVTRGDILALSALDAVLIGVFRLFYRPILYVSFDRTFSRTQQIPTRVISYLMMILVAATVVLSIRVVGIVLLVSMLTLPVITVNTFTKSYPKLLVFSSLAATLGAILGLWFSYQSNIPSGAAIICVLTLMLIIAKVISRLVKLSTVN